jgi:hypothetical protein
MVLTWLPAALFAIFAVTVASTCPSGPQSLINVNSSIRYAGAYTLNATNTVTVGMWAHLANCVGNIGLFAYGTASVANEFSIAFDCSTSQYGGSVKGTPFTLLKPSMVAPSTLTDTRPHAVVISWHASSAVVEIWEDAVLLGTVSVSSSPLVTPGCVTVGQIPSSGCTAQGFASYHAYAPGTSAYVSQVRVRLRFRSLSSR